MFFIKIKTDIGVSFDQKGGDFENFQNNFSRP